MTHSTGPELKFSSTDRPVPHSTMVAFRSPVPRGPESLDRAKLGDHFLQNPEASKKRDEARPAGNKWRELKVELIPPNPFPGSPFDVWVPSSGSQMGRGSPGGEDLFLLAARARLRAFVSLASPPAGRCDSGWKRTSQETLRRVRGQPLPSHYRLRPNPGSAQDRILGLESPLECQSQGVGANKAKWEERH